MKLTILGCAGSVPGPDSPASGYLITAGETRVLVDFGNGALGALQRVVDPFQIDAVLLSHLHPDHCADIAGLTVLRRYHPEPPYSTRQRRLPLFGPDEAPSRLAALYAPSESERAETDLSDVFEFHPQPETPMRIGEIEIQAFPVCHVCPGWGFRITAAGKVLAYTGDTGPCDSLVGLARDVDVLLSEASWPDSEDVPDGVHLSGTQAGDLAAQAGVRRLLLTHVQPWVDGCRVLAEAGERFDGPVELVAAGRTYTV